MGVEMAVASAVIGLAGAGVSAYGQMQAGESRSQAASYRAQVAENNREIAERNAQLVMQAGDTAATNLGLKVRAKVGAQKAAQGASGIDVNSGSAADVRAGTEEIGMLDALTVRSNAAKDAYGELVKATSEEANASLSRQEATYAEQAGEIGAAGTLLSGASSVAGSFGRYQNLYGSTASAAPRQTLGDPTRLGSLY